MVAQRPGCCRKKQQVDYDPWGYDPVTWNLDPVANPTVIDGQGAYRGIYVLGLGSPNVRLTMSNITIRDAVAEGTDADPASGGGMRVDNAAVTLDSGSSRGG